MNGRTVYPNCNKCPDLTFFFSALSSQVLKRPEYFGKFGKIHKVVINNSTSYAGSQVRSWIKSVTDRFLLNLYEKAVTRG